MSDSAHSSKVFNTNIDFSKVSPSHWFPDPLAYNGPPKAWEIPKFPIFPHLETLNPSEICFGVVYHIGMDFYNASGEATSGTLYIDDQSLSDSGIIFTNLPAGSKMTLNLGFKYPDNLPSERLYQPVKFTIEFWVEGHQPPSPKHPSIPDGTGEFWLTALFDCKVPAP